VEPMAQRIKYNLEKRVFPAQLSSSLKRKRKKGNVASD
jgi:hypothetical protein